jgi:RNA polymerase sigma-70 factor (ECF subfamily)
MLLLAVSSEVGDARSAAGPGVEEGLVAAARAGDRRAMERLYRLHGAVIHAYLLRAMGDRATAEELVQETFVRAFRAVGRFDGRSSFRTWLFAIATNRARTALSKRRTLAARESLDERELDRAASPSASTEEAGDRAWAQRRLAEALKALPEGYREVVIMHDVLEMEHQEIAAARGCSIGTSKSQLHKARARLRELLHKLGGER